MASSAFRDPSTSTDFSTKELREQLLRQIHLELRHPRFRGALRKSLPVLQRRPLSSLQCASSSRTFAPLCAARPSSLMDVLVVITFSPSSWSSICPRSALAAPPANVHHADRSQSRRSRPGSARADCPRRRSRSAWISVRVSPGTSGIACQKWHENLDFLDTSKAGRDTRISRLARVNVQGLLSLGYLFR